MIISSVFALRKPIPILIIASALWGCASTGAPGPASEIDRDHFEVTCEIAEDAKNATAAATLGKTLAELMHKKKLLIDFKNFVRKIDGSEEEEPAKKSGFLKGSKAGRAK